MSCWFEESKAKDDVSLATSFSTSVNLLFCEEEETQKFAK